MILFDINPFDLAGPQFLLFYAEFSALVIVAYALYVIVGPRSREGTTHIDRLSADPYGIACLREGPDEAVRLAVINLIDRDLLTTAKGNALHATLRAQPEALRRALDKVIVERCTIAPLPPAEILADRAVRQAAGEVETDLQRQGLLLSAADHGARRKFQWLAIALLAGLAVARIAQALSHGRGNIAFLVVLALLACAIVWVLPTRRLTRAGRRSLAHLQALMKRLKDRSHRLAPGGASNEAVLFAAVFGIHALPAAAFPFVAETFPKPQPTGDSGSGSSSDSGGSSSDGGGSGCGGGGGCGGCGGGGGD